MNNTFNRPRRLLCVLVVEKTPNLRKSLEGMLLSIAEVGIVASVGSGIKALMYLDRMQPDLVLVNHPGTDMNRVQLAQKIKRKSPEVHFIITSIRERHTDFELGACRDCTFVLKRSLRHVLLGEVHPMLDESLGTALQLLSHAINKDQI